ncbi:MAG: hypothetical protein EAZ92_08845 [Candidatus Kapaibacterium sp.]|nr:MAG: hypothetical protein EAZ92_08845 [Candidatus Kapabacteria bacterium]
MDTATLKEALLRYAETFQNEGRPFDFLGFAPLYHFPSTSYVVQVHGVWIDEASRRSDMLEMLVARLLTDVPSNVMRFINRITICSSEEHVYSTPQTTLINTCGFMLPSVPHNFLED